MCRRIGSYVRLRSLVLGSHLRWVSVGGLQTGGFELQLGHLLGPLGGGRNMTHGPAHEVSYCVGWWDWIDCNMNVY